MNTELASSALAEREWVPGELERLADRLIALLRDERLGTSRNEVASVASALRHVAAKMDATDSTSTELGSNSLLGGADETLERLNEAVEHHSPYRDPLTGLLVKTVGREQMNQAIDRAQRSGESLVIAFADIDGLAGVNATFGYSVGDDLLSDVGTLLWTNLRTYDIVARYGGDEFVCALPGASLKDAQKRFNDVAQAIAATTLGTALSIGLAVLDSSDTLDDVLARAEANMFEQRRIRRVSLAQRPLP